ncbi:heat shock protein HslJ [Ulvibacter sp. MAR_2010_11]|uniref:META domain-containing protein n=1 Tax=Ulvibacter sp. MAR_2010_11 TaxID=1250229 RepID=UPI000C2BAAD1|nr:META domain-containing protein [Ulvibacter sp. MAR_2010_11]PKA82778.1 heat shock protein HslJ [Ulvibacter sp. MAR_2010_11]
MKKLILLFTISIALMSCDETKKVIDVAGSVQLSGTYNVTSIEGKNVATLADKKAFITFAALDKTIRGNTGCNDFFGSYTLDLYALSFSGVGSTKMYCEEPVMTTERNFMQALNNTGSYGIQENVLTLYSKTDRSVLLTAKKETN